MFSPPTGAQGKFAKCNDLLDAHWLVPIPEAELQYMSTAKNNQKIWTRNYADWKLPKNRCRQSSTCGDSDNEDAFDQDKAVGRRATP